MRKCLFCENAANTREHVWPEWVLNRLHVKEPIRAKMGTDPEQLLPNPEQKVKAVCRTCNEGWMHELEVVSIPLVGNLMQDVSLALDGLQQYRVSTWAVRMAMVGDFLARRQRPLFFDQAEREQLRVATNLPMRTKVWLARFQLPGHVGFWGTHSWSLDKSIHAFITTVLVGHLALQVVTLKCDERWDDINVIVAPKPGPLPWAQMATEIWPTTVSVSWPPNYSFKNGGQFSVFSFIRRYSYGENSLDSPID